MTNRTPEIYRMKGRVVLRRIGEDRLLVPVAGGAAQASAVFPLNDTGEFLWSRLAQGVPAEAAARGLAQEFEVDPAAALADVRAFAAELAAHGLLEEAAE